MKIILEQGKYEDKKYARMFWCRRCGTVFASDEFNRNILEYEKCPICYNKILILFQPYLSESEFNRLVPEQIEEYYADRRTP